MRCALSQTNPPEGALCNPAVAKNHPQDLHPSASLPWDRKHLAPRNDMSVLMNCMQGVGPHHPHPETFCTEILLQRGTCKGESLTLPLWHLLCLQTPLQLFSALAGLFPPVASWHRSMNVNTKSEPMLLSSVEVSAASPFPFPLPHCSSSSHLIQSQLLVQQLLELKHFLASC